jgi:hypothetical protein
MEEEVEKLMTITQVCIDATTRCDDDERIERWLDANVGVENFGPISMSVVNRMVSKRGFTVRLIYKAIPSLDHPGVYVHRENRDCNYRTPYADIVDIDMLRDSGMYLLIFLYRMSTAAVKKRVEIQKMINDGSFTTTLSIMNNDGCDIVENAGHVVCCPGNGMVISNDLRTGSHLYPGAKKDEIKSIEMGHLTPLTLSGMKGMKGVSTSLGMYFYELVPTVLLELRERECKTRCAEALLHVENVPGCSRATKQKAHLKYMKSCESVKNSVCVLKNVAMKQN